MSFSMRGGGSWVTGTFGTLVVMASIALGVASFLLWVIVSAGHWAEM